MPTNFTQSIWDPQQNPLFCGEGFHEPLSRFHASSMLSSDASQHTLLQQLPHWWLCQSPSVLPHTPESSPPCLCSAVPRTAQFPPSTMPALKKPEHCQQAAFLLSHIPFCKWGFMHTHKWYNRCHLSQLCPVTDMASANSTQLHDKLPFSYWKSTYHWFL